MYKSAIVLLYFIDPKSGTERNLTGSALKVPEETSIATIIGGAAAGLVPIVVVVVTAIVLYRKRKSSNKSDSSGEIYMYYPSTERTYTEPDYVVSPKVSHISSK